MALSPALVDDDQHLIRYLLGLLPEEEAEPLDEASVADDEFPARLGSVEDDLIDAYIRGRLDPELRARFEAVYLASPRRRARVEFGERFLAALDARANRSRAPSRIIRPMVAAAVLVFTCGTLLLGYRTLRHGASSEPQMAVARPDTSGAGSAVSPSVSRPVAGPNDTPVALTLFPQTRGAEQLPTLVLSSGTDRVTLILRLNPSGFASYEAALEEPDTGRPVWQSGAVTASARDGFSAVSLVIPADIFSRQHYTLELKGLDGHRRAEPMASYAFAIERR
jgi:hypothetical protein